MPIGRSAHVLPISGDRARATCLLEDRVLVSLTVEPHPPAASYRVANDGRDYTTCLRHSVAQSTAGAVPHSLGQAVGPALCHTGTSSRVFWREIEGSWFILIVFGPAESRQCDEVGERKT